MNRRATVLFLVVATLLLPMTTFAQTNRNDGGLFGTSYPQVEKNPSLMSNGGMRDVGPGSFNNQAFGGYENLTNETFGGDNAPIGSGLAILLGAGLGYAAYKRRKNKGMKKAMLIAMACLLVLGMTQCKKKPTVGNREKVSITVVAVNDPATDTLKTDGEKVDVTYGNLLGNVTYTQGDQLVVGYDGKYVGTLNYNASSGSFSNELSIALSETDQPLYFYFLGNRQGIIEDEASYCKVSIADQSESLPVLSIGASEEIYTGSATYHAYLRNQCALVKFNLTNSIPTDIDVMLKNWINKVKVDFEHHTIVATEGSNPIYSLGDIIMNAESATERWAILPVWGAGSTKAAALGYGYSSAFEIPELWANDYLKDGVSVPRMKLINKFAVAPDKKVCFALGNLQATTSDYGEHWYWSFASRQQDFVGGNAANTSLIGKGIVSMNGTVDLFCWSGYGLCPSYSNNFYGIINGYPAGHGSCSNGYGFKEWGQNPIYNPITETYNAAGVWRTLDLDEWHYLLLERETYPRYSVGDIRVDGQNIFGMKLFPDGYKGPYDSSTEAGWREMELRGVVFLPCAGIREGVEFDGSQSIYWMSFIHGGDLAVGCHYDESSLKPENFGFFSGTGGSVRLARTYTGSEMDVPEASLPSVTTTAPTEGDITYTTATCGGNVTSANGGLVLDRGVCWGTSPNVTLDHCDGHISGGKGLGSFTCNITGLTINSTYYMCAYAFNGVGVSYGDEVSFKTKNTDSGYAGDPTVTTSVPQNAIASCAAMCCGTVTSDGGSTVVQRGMIWGTTSNVDWSNKLGYTTDGAGMGEFWSRLSGLSPDNTYYVRAYAMNSAKSIGYGNAVEIHTNASTHGFSVSNGEWVHFSSGNLKYHNDNGWGILDPWNPSYSILFFQWGSWTGVTPSAIAGEAQDIPSWDDMDFFQELEGKLCWRTLTRDEINYILFERQTTSGLRFARAYVNDKQGLILLPDDWDASTYALNYCNNSSDYLSNPFGGNEIDATGWATMEQAGAVFLPLNYNIDSWTYINSYWTSSPSSSSGYAKSLTSNFGGVYLSESLKRNSLFVRLVR